MSCGKGLPYYIALHCVIPYHIITTPPFTTSNYSKIQASLYHIILCNPLPQCYHYMAHLAKLYHIGEHDDGRAALLPNHAPEVFHRLLQRTLRRNVLPGTIITLRTHAHTNVSLALKLCWVLFLFCSQFFFLCIV